MSAADNMDLKLSALNKKYSSLKESAINVEYKNPSGSRDLSVK